MKKVIAVFILAINTLISASTHAGPLLEQAVIEKEATLQMGQRINFIAPSDSGLSLVIEQGTSSPPLKLAINKLSPRRNYLVQWSLNGGGAKFTDGTTFQEGNNLVDMPSFIAPLEFDISYLQIYVNSEYFASIKVIASNQGSINIIRNSSPTYSGSVKFLGSNYAMLDESIVNANLAVSNSGDESASLFSPMALDGTGEDFSSSGVSFRKSYSCSRPYSTSGRQSSGIVHWDVQYPRAFHTLKDENRGNNDASSLRCPLKSQGTTDYYIDGIYNIFWFANSPVKALKIPDHCSVVANSAGYATCCFLPLIPIYGSVRFINPRDPSLIDWPDNVRVCTNNE